MNKAKSRQHSHRKGKRNVQNQRTFQNVQTRRKRHADNHGITVADLGATRWTIKPTSKS